MARKFITLAVGLMLAALCTLAPAGAEVQVTDKFDASSAKKIEVAGRLLVDLHSEILLAVDKNQVVNNWFNAGYMWGDFGDFGFAGPRSQYPTLTTVDGVAAVTFNGKNVLVGSPVVPKDKVNDSVRGNLATPESMYGPNAEYTVEAWVNNPTIEPGEAIVSWGQSYLPYPDAKYAPAKKWHHTVVIHSSGQDTLYVDGKKQAQGRFVEVLVGAVVAQDAPIELGTVLGSKSFSGSIAALRIHEKPMTEAQITANYQGGIDLGTTCVPNIDPASAADDVNWGPSDNPKYKQVFSPHFRMMWDPAKDVNGVMTETAARNMLIGYERVYDAYVQMGMHTPIVSCNKNLRGDGIKYKINIAIGWDNGAWGGYNGARGFGFPIHGPGVVHAHELGHATQSHQMGGLAGNWWETHTQWLSKDFDNMSLGTSAVAGAADAEGSRFNYNNAMIGNANFFVSNGRDYYHCFHIFCQLGLEPELGPMFIAKLWNTNGWDSYPFKRGEDLFPDKIELLKDQWVKMGRRNITWDYPDAMKNPPGVELRNSRTLLEPIPYEPGTYRCPKDMAPQQFGYVICPLEPKSKTVTVDLGGYINSERGSDWRAGLVAVNSRNEARYGDIFGPGKNSMTLNPDEKDLYLVVAATPKIMSIDMVGDYRSFEQHQFPFTVKLTGCEPKDYLAPSKPAVPGKAHPNGGGFVAATAKVDATAYVGPNAQVLGSAKVLGNARVEDYAVVKDTATVRDHAVVSGHALVSGAAVVRDYAKVRDFASVTSLTADFAKVAEHAVNGGQLKEYAVAKGCAASFGSNYGTSIVDGMYAKGNEVSKGMWLTWSWGTGKNAGELDEDLGGVYAQYLFEKPHPYLALDTYGVTYGYLVGNPTVANGVLTLNGKNQFVEMPKDVADMHDITLQFKVNWSGGKNQMLWSAGIDGKNCMFLTPSDADGALSFVIVKDGKAQAVKAKSALPTGKLSEVKVILSDDTATLYVDGASVGQDQKFTYNPEDVKSVVAYLGRGIDGGYFSGQIDEATVYSIALIDNSAPYPNPAAWRVEPVAHSDSSVTMYAQAGCDPKPGIEYFFTETTGKGHNSGWQASPVYQDKGLKAGQTYTYTVKMRDAAGNETKPSVAKSTKWEASPYFLADKTPDGAPLFVMEAEHFQKNIKGTSHDWTFEDLLSNFRGEGAMYCGPEDGPAVGDYMLDAPRLDYRFKVDQPGTYYVWTRGFGRWWMSNSVYLAVDGKLPQKAYVGWENLTYRWKHCSNMDSNKPLDAVEIDSPGVHTLSVWMGDDGGSVDAFILTTANYDQYQPTAELNINKDFVGKGPKECRVEMDGKPVEVVVPVKNPVWSSLQPVIVGGTRAVMQAKNYADRLGDVEYFFEESGGAAARESGWQKEPYYEFKGLAGDKEYAYRYKVRSASVESGWSEAAKAKWDVSKAYTEPADGVTVIEAEHFAANVPASDGHQWQFAKSTDGPDIKASGDGYMKTNIKSGSPFIGKTLEHKARMDYLVDFTKTGPHYIWVRAFGEYRFNRFLVVGMDAASGDWGKVDLGWEGLSWKRSGAIDVTTPGVHSINLWLNNDAIVVDKVIVTTDVKFKPSTEADSSDGSPTGIGPAETKSGK